MGKLIDCILRFSTFSWVFVIVSRCKFTSLSPEMHLHNVICAQSPVSIIKAHRECGLRRTRKAQLWMTTNIWVITYKIVGCSHLLKNIWVSSSPRLASEFLSVRFFSLLTRFFMKKIFHSFFPLSTFSVSSCSTKDADTNHLQSNAPIPRFSIDW